MRWQLIAYPQAKLVLWATVAFSASQVLPSSAPGQTPCIPVTELVLDEHTRVPLAGARVNVSWRDGSAQQLNVRTDSTGRALLCVPPQQPVTIRASYLDQAVSWQTSFTAGASRFHTSLIDAPSSYVRGRILDQQTNSPVPQVVVRVANTALRTFSDAEGRFFFERIPIGRYTLQVEHIGYADQRAPLEVGRDDLDALIRVAPAAIALQPIIVTAFSRRLEAVGFYDRRKRGIGTFIDRKRIDAMNVNAASDLLRAVPGVRLIPQTRTRSNQPQNATVGARGNCRFVFIVDGSRTLSDFEMDYLAGPAIEGVEIYNGMADVPAGFKAHATSVAGSTVCGVIAIWMRNSR